MRSFGGFSYRFVAVGVARFAEDNGAPEFHEEADRTGRGAVTWTPDVPADGDCKNAWEGGNIGRRQALLICKRRF